MTQFYNQFCKDGEIWHLLAFVRNKLGVPVESYGRINIKKCITKVIYHLLTQWNICLSILSDTIKHLQKHKAICQLSNYHTQKPNSLSKHLNGHLYGVVKPQFMVILLLSIYRIQSSYC